MKLVIGISRHSWPGSCGSRPSPDLAYSLDAQRRGDYLNDLLECYLGGYPGWRH
jgi:hypothetical protein